MDVYEKIADDMWINPKPGHLEECVRPQGHVVRFDPNTDAYCVLGSDRTLRTLFKPIPCVSVPLPQRPAQQKAGRCHQYPTNVAYFKARCL